jgi:hypothetical protein
MQMTHDVEKQENQTNLKKIKNKTCLTELLLNHQRK